MKNFHDINEDSKRINEQLLYWKTEQRSMLDELRELIVDRVTLMHELKVVPRNMLPQEPGPRDYLAGFQVQGDKLEAHFGFVFRNERNSYEVYIPLRYLGDDGRAQIAQEAAAARQQEAQDAEAAQAAARQSRLQQYHELQAEFGRVPTPEGA